MSTAAPAHPSVTGSTARVLLALVLALACVVTAPLDGPARASAAAEVADPAAVWDDVGVIEDPEALEDRLESASAETGVRLVVLTVDEPDVSESSYDEDVRTYVTAKHPTAFTASDGVLQDDVVLLAVSPELRQLGAYAGDGVEGFDEDVVDQVTEAMVDPAQDGDWDATATAGVDRWVGIATGEIDPADEGIGARGVLWGLGGAAVLAVGGAGWWVLAHRRPDAERTAAVTRDWEALREEALARRALSVHEEADAALTLLRDSRGEDGRVTSAAMTSERAELRRVLRPEAAQQARERLGYYARPTGWERTWEQVVQQLAGEAVEAAEESVDQLEQLDADEDTREAARDLARRHRERLDEVDAAVRDRSSSVEDGEVALQRLTEDLVAEAQGFRKQHTGARVEGADDVGEEDLADARPAHQASLLPMHLVVVLNAQNASSTSTTTYTSTGGFSGGSRGF